MRAPHHHALARPRRPHRDDGLVRQVVALLERDAERRELLLEVAGPDPEDDASARQRVERRDGLGEEERVAVRGDAEVRVEPHRRRRRGRHRERDEGIERVVTARLEPAVGRERVLGHEHGVEPRRLGRL